MAKTYGLVFTNSNPLLAPATSLAPTFLAFYTLNTGVTVAPPTITKPLGVVGIYTFSWTPTTAMGFVVDGGTLITDNAQRYLTGILDPIQDVDEQLTAFGSTFTAANVSLFALGVTNIAQTVSITAQGVSIIAQNVTTQAGLTLVFAQDISLLALGNTILAGVTNSAINVSLIMGAIGSTLSSFGTLNNDPSDLFGMLKRIQEFNEGSQQFNKTSGVWTIESRSGVTLVSKQLTNNSSQVTRG